MAQGDKLIKLEGLKEVYHTLDGDMAELKSTVDITNEAVLGTSAADFPMQFENGTYESTAVGTELIKYYGGGYDLTRKVLKTTTFNATCRVHITAKAGYVFSVFPATNGVIDSSLVQTTECTMYPGRQYGMTLRTVGGADNISGVDVSDIVEIEYESNADVVADRLSEDLKAVTDQPENICYVTPGAMGRIASSTYYRQSAKNKDVIEAYGTSNGLGNVNPFNGSMENGTNSLIPTRYLAPGKYTVYFTRSNDYLRVCQTQNKCSDRTTVQNGSTITAGEDGLSVFIHVDSGVNLGTSENPSTISLRIYRGENVPDVVTAVDRVARNSVAPILDDMVADTNLSVNDFRIVGNTLYRITASVAAGGSLTVGTNCVATTIAEQISAILNS